MTTPSMEILNKYETDEERIAALSEALDDLHLAYAAALRMLPPPSTDAP